MNAFFINGRFKTIVLIVAMFLGTIGWVHASSHSVLDDKKSYAECKKECGCVKKRLERLSKHLNLTAEQQTQIKSVLESSRDQRKAIDEATHKQIGKLLTSEQKETFGSMHKKRSKKECSKKYKKRQDKQKGEKNLIHSFTQ